MTLLETWTLAAHTAEGHSFPTYRKGTGPGVVVVHELPGLIPEVIEFGETVVAAGFTVVMPDLFGTPERSMGPRAMLASLPNVCIRKEFNKLRVGQTSPIAGWLRSLARELHGELGGPGVGALGMCFTGGFALAMMVDDAVAAPVVCQPSLPFPIGKARGADLGLSPADLTRVKERAAGGCEVLGLQFEKDPATGTRFDTLERELGAAFIRVDLPGKGHSTVTGDKTPDSVARVLSFFDEKLKA